MLYISFRKFEKDLDKFKYKNTQTQINTLKYSKYSFKCMFAGTWTKLGLKKNTYTKIQKIQKTSNILNLNTMEACLRELGRGQLLLCRGLKALIDGDRAKFKTILIFKNILRNVQKHFYEGFKSTFMACSIAFFTSL